MCVRVLYSAVILQRSFKKNMHFISLSGGSQQEAVGCLGQPIALCIIDLLQNIVIFTQTHSKQNFNLAILPRVSCYDKLEQTLTKCGKVT
jgi:hypothetical protein